MKTLKAQNRFCDELDLTRPSKFSEELHEELGVHTAADQVDVHIGSDLQILREDLDGRLVVTLL